MIRFKAVLLIGPTPSFKIGLASFPVDLLPTTADLFVAFAVLEPDFPVDLLPDFAVLSAEPTFLSDAFFTLDFLTSLGPDFPLDEYGFSSPVP